MNSKKLALLGPGKTTLDFKPEKQIEVLAFQEVFPHCVSHIDIIPDYWICGDPNSYIVGMKYLLENTSNEELKKIQVLIPDIFMGDVSHYRRYCGTSPLVRTENGWSTFKQLISEVSSLYDVKIIPVTTTKYIKLFDQSNTLKDIQTPNHEYLRFMSEKVIFGTVEFDSESVIGNQFKWGLENKLTSVALPVCYFLRAIQVDVYGFDYQGPRFYSPDARHPWSDETQKAHDATEFSLSLLKKWIQWESIHGMKLFSGTSNPISLPSKHLKQKTKEEKNDQV